MKISLNEIKKLVPEAGEISAAELTKLIGSRLVEVEGTINLAEKYKGAYIVRVAECEAIPETHLHLCKIETGGVQRAGDRADGSSESLVQVVCGAPNVRAGMLAVWLAPGAVVPQTYGEENFKLDVRKLRGYESNGMLAGLDEIDLGDDHSGIVEIDPHQKMPDGARELKPGDSFAEAFELNDIILDIENKSLTHRPDTFGIIGFAREVAGILGAKFDEEGATQLAAPGDLSRRREGRIGSSPVTTGRATGAPGVADVAHFSGNAVEKDCAAVDDNRKNSQEQLIASRPSKNAVEKELQIVDIDIKDNALCPRYSCAVIEMKDALEDDKYLTAMDVFLSKAGMRGISKIVDVTNYMMLMTGQPLHAFDYDKFVKVGGAKTPKIIVRAAREGEKLQLLDGKTIKCNAQDIMITSNNTPVALAGAMGGASTEIDASTTRVILESATFSLYNLRKTQMAHGIFSEAITRFTKGQPAAQTVPVLSAACEMLGGKVVGFADAYPEPAKQNVVKITTDEINSLLGTEYESELIVKTLGNVGFEVEVREERGVTRLGGTPVEHRASDAQMGEDGAAGPRAQQPDSSLPISVKVPLWRTDIHIKEDIIEEVGRLLGYDNIPLDFPTRPFVGAKEDAMLKLKSSLRNILSDQLAAHEILTYSFVSKKLLENVGEDAGDSYEIVNSISPELQCFRQSLIPSLLEKTRDNLKAGYKDFALYEINQVSKKSYGLDTDGVPILNTHVALVTTGDFYKMKAMLVALLKSLGFSAPEFSEYKNDLPYFENKHAASVKVPEVACGEIKSAVRKRMKIEQELSAFEISLETLLSELPKAAAKMPELSKFPAVERDVTLKVKSGVSFAAAEAAIKAALEKTEDLIYALTPVSIYQKQAEHKNLSFHLEFASKKKTLENSEISGIMEEVQKSVAQAVDAEII